MKSSPSSRFSRTSLARAISLTSLAIVSNAMAQSTEEPASPQMEQMVIEGEQLNSELQSRKITASLLNTPRSVTVISADQIEARGSTSLVDTLKTVPGITFNAGEGGAPAGDNLKIRGFDAGADVFVDGVRDGGSQTRDIFGLEQVEVMMGPGSAFSGRGSAGGSVNLATKRPYMGDALSLRMGAGSDDQYRVAVDGNYQFGDTSAARLNLLWNEGDVPGRDSVYYSHRGVAPSLAFGMGEATRVNLDYYYYRTDDMPDYSIPYDNGQPANVDRDNFYGLLNRDFQKTGSDIATFSVEHDFGPNLTLSNTTRYGLTSNDYVVTNPDDSHGNVENGFVWRGTKSRNAETETRANQTDLYGTLTLAGLQHRFALGLEFSSEELRRTNYSISSNFSGRGGTSDPTSCSFPGVVGAPSGYECTSLDNPNPSDPWVGTVTPSGNHTLAETETRAAYFFDTLTLNERWLLNAGLRFDDYETSQGDARNASEFWNYQLGLIYKPSEDASIYLSTGTSSRPSGNAPDGTDSLRSSNEDLEPERNRTYELGGKWLLADGRVAMQSSIFQNIKENARVATEPGRGAPQETVGEQRVSGFEVSMRGQLTDFWSLTASYNYLESELVDDGPVSSNTGNDFPNTPQNSFNLWTSFNISQNLLVGAGANYVDKRYGNTSNTVFIPSYTTYDMMAAYRLNNNSGLQLNIQNLTDEAYFTRPYAAHYAAIGPGRSIVLTYNLDL